LRNHQYADDTQLYLLFSTNPGEAVAVLNQCLAEVREWMRANKLKLNPDKTEVLLVGGSGFGEGGFDLVLNGATLPLRDKVRSLGVLLDPELSLEAQVTAVARNAFLQLRLINQLHPYLEYDCLATVTHALVTSRLDFCNALYVGLPLKTVRTLQLVQNRAARLLTGTGRYAHMTPVLRQLHWLPIEARAQFKVLIMTYKALNGLGPGYLNERLCPYMPDRPLRSAGESLLRERSMKEIRRAPPWAYIACACGLFIYQSLDAIDGKQARRTNSSSPLGELFDHGCDSLSTVFVVLGTCIAVQLGTNPDWMFFCCFAGTFMFYCAHWQTYVSGTLRFGIFDVTESELCIIITHLLTGILGPKFWNVTVTDADQIDVTEVQVFIIIMHLLAVIGGTTFWETMV
ncbi:Choline/ethanolaminephosphotransferase 1, partial [Varanus komodoensis]